MFEYKTYDNILAEMLADLPDGLSGSEGSLIYTALSKQAMRLEEAYMQLDGLDKNAYTDTADLEHLILDGNEKGVIFRYATYATMRGQLNLSVPAGTRFNGGDYNYTVLNVLDEENHIYALACDTPGAEPNHWLGELTPIETIEGFESGKIIGVEEAGKDMEDTEIYRKRLLSNYDVKSFGGNRQYYKYSIESLAGVGGVKIARRKENMNYIDAQIISADFATPSETTVKNVQDAVDPEQSAGEGDGLAPIGHVVHITGVPSVAVDIETTVTYDTGYDYTGLASYINKAVDDYLLELRMTWAGTGTIMVRIIQIESRIVDIAGIVDVTGTKINGQEQNLAITTGIPVKGVLICNAA